MIGLTVSFFVSVDFNKLYFVCKNVFNQSKNMTGCIRSFFSCISKQNLSCLVFNVVVGRLMFRKETVTT